MPPAKSGNYLFALSNFFADGLGRLPPATVSVMGEAASLRLSKNYGAVAGAATKTPANRPSCRRPSGLSAEVTR
jgi:hypothetical protein